MPKHRTDLEKAAGLLISAVQKEWGDVVGEPGAEVSEEVMHNCHSLLQAAKTIEGLSNALDGRSVTDYLGRSWVRLHPDVLPAIKSLERLLTDGSMPNNSFKPNPLRGSA
jgi:hypothetical protein